MHDTLPALVERALAGMQRPLEFYLCEQSRLPGTRANLELLDDFSALLAEQALKRPKEIRILLNYLVRDAEHVNSNTPDEFVVMCGIVSFGTCAIVQEEWRDETCELLAHYAGSTAWRVREAAAIAYQRLIAAIPKEALAYLTHLVEQGTCYQQRAAMAAVAEPALLGVPEIIEAALRMQRIVLERFRELPASERRRDDVRSLRQALGYTLSVITAATPELGFALMYECAAWGDADINWILRENLKKRRLAKYREYTERVIELLA